MKLNRVSTVVLAGFVCLVVLQASAVTHTELQAVDSMGVSTWTSTDPFTITGVILNNPEDMLDSTYVTDPVGMGAQWQIFIQGTGGDHCGTALWMGQNYSCLGSWNPYSYDESTWSSEMQRLNYYDQHNFLKFRQGDLVTVTVNKTKFYGGKRNINEAHSTEEANNFYLTLETAGYGLLAPDEITLSDLYVNPSTPGYNAAYPMFDPSRGSGAEYYQGVYVKLTGLTFTNADGWGETAWADRICTVTDGLGHECTLRMPLSDLGDVPTGEFGVYGFINQETGADDDGRFGYEVFVTDIVPEPATISILLAGIGSCLIKRRQK